MDDNPLETLTREFSEYHQAARDANDKLTDEVKDLRERIGKIILPAAARGNVQTGEQLMSQHHEQQHRAAFVKYIRTGEMETRGLATTPDDSGGFVVPPYLDKQIHDILISISPIRAISRNIAVSNAGEITI